jgi:hypothetical protein
MEARKFTPWKIGVQLPNSSYELGCEILNSKFETNNVCLRTNMGLFLGAISCCPRTTFGHVALQNLLRQLDVVLR